MSGSFRRPAACARANRLVQEGWRLSTRPTPWSVTPGPAACAGVPASASPYAPGDPARSAAESVVRARALSRSASCGGQCERACLKIPHTSHEAAAPERTQCRQAQTQHSCSAAQMQRGSARTSFARRAAASASATVRPAASCARARAAFTRSVRSAARAVSRSASAAAPLR
jgi:hypothetical protein